MTNGSFSTEENDRIMMKRIDELTQERDRLRLDSNLFRRKLQEANNIKMAIVQEKDERIADLMKSIGNLTVLIDETEERNEKMLEGAASNSKSVREVEAELSDTVCQLNKLRGSYELLKQQVHSSKRSGTKADEEVEKLEKELLQVILEKDEMAGKFDECMNELERYKEREDVSIMDEPVFCLVYMLTFSALYDAQGKWKENQESSYHD
jgi:chromosome segregation ATPase